MHEELLDHDQQLKMKLTISVDENPDLFFVLRDIRDRRRRTRRLKDLAVKGLLLERAPAPTGAAAPQPITESHGRRTPVGESVSSMLDWGDPAAEGKNARLVRSGSDHN
jgi:hypothetical protein